MIDLDQEKLDKNKKVKRGYRQETVNFGKNFRNCVLNIVDELVYLNLLPKQEQL